MSVAMAMSVDWLFSYFVQFTCGEEAIIASCSIKRARESVCVCARKRKRSNE